MSNVFYIIIFQIIISCVFNNESFNKLDSPSLNFYISFWGGYFMVWIIQVKSKFDFYEWYRVPYEGGE